jgi:formiminotetrahydrofolate cyclodeaminase
MEKYINLPLKQFTDDLAAHKDAPGGGSACGLVGSLASALGSMVCNFTIGRKKYADVEDRVKVLLTEFDQLRTELLDLMQKDVDVFHSEMGSAFALPKNTDEEKALRKEAIENACKSACQAPLEIARKSCKLLKMFVELAEKGNTQLVSDVGVAISFAVAAFEGAKFNIDINLNFIADKGFVKSILAELTPLASAVHTLKDHAQKIVLEKMKW